MKLIEVGRDPLQSDVVRVVVERPGQDPVTLLRDGAVWRLEGNGEPANAVFAASVDRLLWLHRREQARKVQEERVKVERLLGRPGTAHHVSKGYVVDPTKVVQEGEQAFIPKEALQRGEYVPIGSSTNPFVTWFPITGDVPAEEYVTPQAFVERPLRPWAPPVSPPFDGGTLTAEEFAQGAERVRTGESGAVFNQRTVEAMGVVMVDEPEGVRHLPPPPRLSVGWRLLTWRVSGDCLVLAAAYDNPERVGRMAMGRWVQHADGAWSCEEGWSSDGETLPQVPPLREGA